MFLHLGSGVSVLTADVVAVLDMETATTMRDSREFLKMCDEEEFIFTVAEGEMPKSVVVTDHKGKSAVYVSPLASSTIRKRFGGQAGKYEENL